MVVITTKLKSASGEEALENGNTDDDDEPAIPWLSQPVWGYMFALIILVPYGHFV